MMEVILLKLFFLCLISSINVTAQHRNPPGVNPQQYQQAAPGVPPPQQYQAAPGVPPPQQYQAAPGVPPPQQYQAAPGVPPPQQYQAAQGAPPPQQYQAAPPAQQYNQGAPQAQQQGGQQYQQVPQAQAHAHGGAPKVLHKQNINDERAHIKDHMEVPLDTSGMSEQELQFHYFKMHDADNNNRLDGQELIKSLFHWHDESSHDAVDKQGAHQPPEGEKIFTDNELVEMIDPILLQDDHNGDGYIDYAEFMAAQKKTVTTTQ